MHFRFRHLLAAALVTVSLMIVIAVATIQGTADMPMTAIG
jgi:hypothetical protein